MGAWSSSHQFVRRRVERVRESSEWGNGTSAGGEEDDPLDMFKRRAAPAQSTAPGASPAIGQNGDILRGAQRRLKIRTTAGPPPRHAPPPRTKTRVPRDNAGLSPGAVT